MISETEAIDLIRLRYFHHRLNELLKTGEFKRIPVHLAFGREAVAVGMDISMAADDILCVSHRNVAFNLARTKSLESVLKHYRIEQGIDRQPQMASMNLAVDNTSIVYASSILGNNLAVATGIAMNRKLANHSGIAFVATGDGAIEEGVFWESLIFARSHALGVVVVIENDDCSMSSTISQRRSAIDLSLICSGLGVPYYNANGASLPAIKAALAAARNDSLGRTPVVVEFNVSTFCQHAGPTPGWPDDPLRIDLAHGLLLGEEPNDPLIHLVQAIGTLKFNSLADLVIKNCLK